jgi:hypothetical protein
MRKPNKVALFLLIPIGIFLWFLGWSLYWIGSHKMQVNPKKTYEGRKLTFTVLMPEQKYAE